MLPSALCSHSLLKLSLCQTFFHISIFSVPYSMPSFPSILHHPPSSNTHSTNLWLSLSLQDFHRNSSFPPPLIESNHHWLSLFQFYVSISLYLYLFRRVVWMAYNWHRKLRCYQLDPPGNVKPSLTTALLLGTLTAAIILHSRKVL